MALSLLVNKMALANYHQCHPEGGKWYDYRLYYKTSAS